MHADPECIHRHLRRGPGCACRLMPSAQDLIRSFRSFDLNNDGVITRDEFVQVLMRPTPGGHPLPLELVDQMFRDADRDGDGLVPLEEFATVWAGEQVSTAREEARRKEQEIEMAVRGALSVQVSPAEARSGNVYSSGHEDGRIDYGDGEASWCRQQGFGAAGARNSRRPQPGRPPIAQSQAADPSARRCAPPLRDPVVMSRCERIEDLLKEKIEEKWTSLREQFKGVNSARDGFIDVAEFKQMFDRCSVAVPPGLMDVLVARFDKDNNGGVDFNEFAKWMAPSYHSNRRYAA